jgi:hypothetical protein
MARNELEENFMNLHNLFFELAILLWMFAAIY